MFTSLCRTPSASGLDSELTEDVLEMEERRLLLQSDARGEQLGDWIDKEEERNKNRWKKILKWFKLLQKLQQRHVENRFFFHNPFK